MVNTNDKYPKPLYDRAVEAYLQEFARRNGLKRTDIRQHGPKEYSMYYIDPWECHTDLDNIRLDVDGLDLLHGRHIDTASGDMLAWKNENFLAVQRINYMPWLMKKYLR